MQVSRLIPMAVWCALVLVGTIFLTFFGKPRGPLAAHPLPPNTYLFPGDLSYSGYDGRYVVAPKGVSQGATVSSSDLGDQPSLLEGPQGRLSLLVNTDRSAVSEGLNAGNDFQLCGTRPTTYGAITVQAVRCEADKNKSRCVALVELPKTGAGDVVAKALKDQTTTSELRLAKKCD